MCVHSAHFRTNVRHRAEKRACRNGNVKACLYLGTYYEDKAPGIIGFLMSYNQDAMTYLEAYKPRPLGDPILSHSLPSAAE